MNDQDYIRKGAELAGWQTTRLGNQRVAVFIPTEDEGTVLRIGYLDEQHILDALATELARRVDALDHWLSVTADATDRRCARWCYFQETIREKGGRTLNSIKAIVDSGVLVPEGPATDE